MAPESQPDWPTYEQPATAFVGPTHYGTFGIVWRAFPAMERRGGYSGPYRTLEDAERAARDWAGYWELPASALRIERVADLATLGGKVDAKP